MKFDKHLPSERLKPYIKQYVVPENENEGEYKVFPSSGLVIGFQYKGKLTTIEDSKESKLASAGITGISDSFKLSLKAQTKLIKFSRLVSRWKPTTLSPPSPK